MERSDIETVVKNTAIVTSTLYKADSLKDIQRAELAKRTFETAAGLGYRIITADGGSPDWLLHSFQDLGATIIEPGSGSMTGDRKLAIAKAGELCYGIMAYTEPEKYLYIKHIAATALPILKGAADIVVPRRKSIRSYPTAQQFAEPLGNLLWEQLTGLKLDMWFGPRTFSQTVSGYFLNYNEKYGNTYEGLYLPLINMSRDAIRIASIEVDYEHPEAQRRMEENDAEFTMKRIAQLKQLAESLGAYAKHNF